VNNLDQAGAIGAGRLADLIVLDRDPFTGPPTDIGATTVLLTYIGGHRVYSAESA
jgi:predicted amidohydrolase YtcJ